MCTSCASCMLVSDALCAYSGQWVRGGAAAAASTDCGSGMLQEVVVAEMLAWAHLQARAASRHVCHNSSSGVYAQAPTASCSEECVRTILKPGMWTRSGLSLAGPPGPCRAVRYGDAG